MAANVVYGLCQLPYVGLDLKYGVQVVTVAAHVAVCNQIVAAVQDRMQERPFELLQLKHLQSAQADQDVAHSLVEELTDFHRMPVTQVQLQLDYVYVHPVAWAGQVLAGGVLQVAFTVRHIFVVAHVMLTFQSAVLLVLLMLRGADMTLGNMFHLDQ
jgi:hypothetical protein